MKLADEAIRKTERRRVGGLVAALLVMAACLCGSVRAQTPSQVQKDEQRLFEAGQAALDQARYDEAIRSYNKLLVLVARDRQMLATVHVKLGYVFVAQRNFERALAEFQQATVLDPDYAVAFNNLGEAQGELKHYNRALESFNRAVAIDPKLSRDSVAQKRAPTLRSPRRRTDSTSAGTG